MASAIILPDRRPALVVLCPRPNSWVGASRRGRLAVRDMAPLTPFTLFVAETGGSIADVGRGAERDGEDVVEEVPLTPLIDV